MDQTTLVTGGTGLIGYNIIRSLLKRNRRVVALVRSREKGEALLPPEVNLIEGDILDRFSAHYRDGQDYCRYPNR